MVDHDIHRVTVSGKKFDDGAKQRLGTGAADARQDDQAGVDILNRDKRSKIPGVLSDQHEVLLDTSRQNVVVRRAQSAEVARMQDNVNALAIELLRDPRRQALIEKQPHGLATA